VTFFCITPGYVASQLTRTSETTLKRCSANVCARGALDKLGMWNLRHSEPYWFHALMVWSTTLMPTFLLEKASYDEMIMLMKQERADHEAKSAERGASARSAATVVVAAAPSAASTLPAASRNDHEEKKAASPAS